jgi:hypothetical protein
VTTILPRESLEVITDIHLYVGGLVPITNGRPIQFKEGEWFDSNNCNYIVGDDKVATIGNVHRILGQFFDVTKKAEEQFFASNQSNKVVNVTMHFIIEFTLNLSIHM